MEKADVNIEARVLLTLSEAAQYTGVGINKLRELTNKEQELVVWVGSKRLLKRRLLQEYLEAQDSL